MTSGFGLENMTITKNDLLRPEDQHDLRKGREIFSPLGVEQSSVGFRGSGRWALPRTLLCGNPETYFPVTAPDL